MYNYFFFISLGGMRLNPLGTSASNWPILPAPDDRWWWVWSGGMRIGRGNTSSRRKPAPVPLCPPHSTWPGIEPGVLSMKPATNHLSNGTVRMICNTRNYWVFGLRPSSCTLKNTTWICFCPYLSHIRTPVDGNRSSFRNVVLSRLQEDGRSPETQ
jgi:hypothetical protein